MDLHEIERQFAEHIPTHILRPAIDRELAARRLTWFLCGDGLLVLQRRHSRHGPLLFYQTAVAVGALAAESPITFLGQTYAAASSAPLFQDFDRADGDCLCSICHRPYRQHPMDYGTLSYADEPYLHVLCDRTRVKL